MVGTWIALALAQLMKFHFITGDSTDSRSDLLTTYLFTTVPLYHRLFVQAQCKRIGLCAKPIIIRARATARQP
jgi:hypothetical protein